MNVLIGLLILAYLYRRYILIKRVIHIIRVNKDSKEMYERYLSYKEKEEDL